MKAWKVLDGKLIISENDIIQDPKGTIIMNGRGECSFLIYPDLGKTPIGFIKSGKINLNLDQDLNPVKFSIYNLESKIPVPIENGIKFSESNSSYDKKIYSINLSILEKDFIDKKSSSSIIDCFVNSILFLYFSKSLS